MPVTKERLWTRDYVMVMISNFTACFSYNAFLTILSVYVNARGGTNVIAGSMAAAMTVVMMICRPIFGNVVDFTGRKPLIRLGGILFALNTIAYMLPLSIPALFVVRMLHGMSQSMYTVSTQTMVADVVPENRLVDGVGFFGVSSSLAGAIGPMTGLWVYETFGAQALFSMMSVFAVSGGISAFLIRTDFKPQRLHAHQSFGKTVKGLVELSAIIPGLIMFFTWFGYSSVSNFLATCAIARGIGKVSLFFTCASGGMVLTRLFAGRITDRIGFTVPIAVGACMVAGSFVILAFAGSLPVILAAGIIYGLGCGMVQPLLNVLIFRFAGPARRGAALATFGLLGDMGTGIGAAVWGVATVSVGYTSTYLLAAICPLIGLVLHMTLLRGRIRALKPPET